MSTFYIYPIDQKDHLHHLHHHHQQHQQQQENNEPGLSMLHSLSATSLSRILEMPLCLLENANSNDQQQVYWLANPHFSNHSTPHSVTTPKEDASTLTATDELVTHSFANRKRSVVKRRKSVLSASFTAEDETEAIHAGRKQALATLERGQEGEEQEENKEETAFKQGILEQDKESTMEALNDAYSLKDLAFDTAHIDVDAFENLKRSQEPNRGKEEEDIPVQQVKIQQDEGANVIHPKDSAIDLRATALEDKDQPAHCVAVNDGYSPCTELIDLSFSSSATSLPFLSPTTLQKKSSWLPRRMFSPSSKKPTPDTAKQDKFNISSFFSRKASSSKKSSSKSNRKSPECASTTKKAALFNPTRLPLHTERAMYRLSHLKLTNPGRPLRDQVIISNFMFWYLSVVSATNNKEHEPTHAMMEHLAMTKKARRFQQQQIHKKKRRMRNQIRPEDSNAMDLISKQPHHPQRSHVYNNSTTRPYSTSNSSSEDEEEDDDNDDDVDDVDSDDDSCASLSTTQDAESMDAGKTSKYSLFSNRKKDKKWLPSFSSKGNNRQQQKQQQKQHQQDEDDIPLAMYQKK